MDRMYTFNIDRGGTFTDFYVQEHDREGNVTNQEVFKVPSVSSNKQGPIEGIKQFLSRKLNQQLEMIPSGAIKQINLGTTLATNALLERKGVRCAILLTSGFQDILTLRNQTRRDIFDLKCQKSGRLASHVYGIDERTYLRDHPNCQKLGQFFVRRPSTTELERIAETLKKQSVNSVGIAFVNSYLNDENEQIVQKSLKNQGFHHVYRSSVSKSLGYLGRSETVTVEAFLSPFMDQYFDDLSQHFDKKPPLRVMRSDGGFSNDKIKASNSLLSGPAGGLIGFSKLIPLIQSFPDTDKIRTVIGLDMGGTSTDVSKFNGQQFEHIYNFTVEQIEINTPHLKIDTIAAGGGSKLTFKNGLFKVGPESVGAVPGPVCYGIGTSLAITDANIVLNRLYTDNFPKVFGKSFNEPINPKLSQMAFSALTEEINKQLDKPKSVEQVALGFVEMGNEMMARSVRQMYSSGKPDALVVFGSAGGQHACGIAQKIGISKIFIHKYSGVLSAYGLSKSQTVEERKRHIGLTISHDQLNKSFNMLSDILRQQEQEMHKQILQQIHQKQSDRSLQIGIKYEGTSYPIIVKFNSHFVQQFEHRHKEEFGFIMSNKALTVEFCRLRVYFSATNIESKKNTHELQNVQEFYIRKQDVCFESGKLESGLYRLEGMKNCRVDGPAILVAKTFSILVYPGWKATVIDENTLLERQEVTSIKNQEVMECDPVKLSLYSSRFMSIAEEMGKALQKTSISTNIKERLDFSCAIFDKDGNLIANAPHLPVHLGSMQTTVIYQIQQGLQEGDVIMTNHPSWGGSHLPDITVISSTNIDGMKFYLAARGHHADIGGCTPGSMPPFSKYLKDQGVAVGRFLLSRNGVFYEEELRKLLEKSRILQDNICDLKAQMAANEIGMRLLSELVKQNGQHEVSAYMHFIRQNAEESVRRMLCDFSVSLGLPEVTTIQESEYMDDGTKIQLHLTINRQERSAIFDFTGTSMEVYGNTNAPESITRSAIIYCLRSLIKSQIPLNSGCLKPVTIIIPKKSILSPSEKSAVVGGNVETSQRLVDLILKPFRYVAASQGTMNNFLFGNSKMTYYETIAGGSGAGLGFSGQTCQCHMTNTRITDCEVFQSRYPVSLQKFQIRKDSGGQGKYKGGDGVVRQFFFHEPMHVSILSERRAYAPYGLEGGSAGKPGVNIVVQNDTERYMGGKSEASLEAGSRIIIMTPGGGGFGSA